MDICQIDYSETFHISDAKTVNIYRDICFQESQRRGWHNPSNSFPEAIALIHSELSEALEGDRKDKMDDHLPHRTSKEVELADAIIRIFDLCGQENIDIGGALVEKFQYNKIRADHDPENRKKPGGKKY